MPFELLARFELHIRRVHRIPMPACFTLESALTRLADEPELALLDSQDAGGSFLIWKQKPIICHDLEDLAIKDGKADSAATQAWPRTVDGGALVQIDYEFPVGPWAAASTTPGIARLWPLKTWLHWHNGQSALCAHDEISIEKLETLKQRLLEPTTPLPKTTTFAPQIGEAKAAWTSDVYRSSIERCKSYIENGDIYQANLTMPFFAPCSNTKGIDLQVFLQLRQHSPAPYSALFRSSGHSIVSHSPECFLSAHNRRCASYPIKGTIKRINNQDTQQRQELMNSEKDRAELAMIIDLVRNDLGRVAEAGTVHVQHKRKILDLPYVHHAVADIQCTLKKDCTHQDLLAASFPPGSITGAPKVRAMEIINELESQSRGAYCGSFGWLGADAQCELAVAIRTIQIEQTQIRFDAGGGIVSDSTADNEWQELHDKASAMRAAIMEQTCATS